MPVTRALRDHVMGIDRTSDGHLLPVLWASSVHFMWWFLGTILGKRICCFLYFVDYNFVFLYNALWWFDDTSMEIMILLWHFFVNIFGSIIFVNHYVSVIYLQTMILWDFLKKKHLCARIKEWVNLRRFVSGSSHHFPEKYRKLENNLFKACLFHRVSYQCLSRFMGVGG